MKEDRPEICKLVIFWLACKIHTNWVIWAICWYFKVCILAISISFKLDAGKVTNKYFSAIKIFFNCFSNKQIITVRVSLKLPLTILEWSLTNWRIAKFIYQFIWTTSLLAAHCTCIFFSMGIRVLVCGNHQLSISTWSFCCPIHEPINLQNSAVVYGVACCWCTEWEWILSSYSAREY